MNFKQVLNCTFPLLELSHVHSCSNPDDFKFNQEILKDERVCIKEIVQKQKDYILNMKVGDDVHLSMFDTNGANLERESANTWILQTSCGGFQVSITMTNEQLKAYVEKSAQVSLECDE